MTTDIEVITQPECRSLLRSNRFGRVAMSVGALPVILPVHFALLGDDPVFRTDPGSKLTAAGAGQVLCLEIDEVDPIAHGGWSVNVIGRSEILTDPDDLAAAALLPLRPWVGNGDAYVRIAATVVTGRRIVTPEEPIRTDLQRRSWTPAPRTTRVEP